MIILAEEVRENVPNVGASMKDGRRDERNSKERILGAVKVAKEKGRWEWECGARGRSYHTLEGKTRSLNLMLPEAGNPVKGSEVRGHGRGRSFQQQGSG